MAGGRLAGKRVLVTQAKDYMGPATIKLFREEGAEVVADESDLTQQGAAEALIEDTGPIDVLVANLSTEPAFGLTIVDTDDDAWHRAFDAMVHPLHRLCRAVLPSMYANRKGKIVVYGSASGVRTFEGLNAYAAARSAQVGYVRQAGTEAARHNVQINLIAQAFVENEYFTPEFMAQDFVKDVMKSVPAGRLATGEEDAKFALFLASNESDFFVGQSILFAGGWKE